MCGKDVGAKLVRESRAKQNFKRTIWHEAVSFVSLDAWVKVIDQELMCSKMIEIDFEIQT
jgi:hypothetical protein